MRRLVVLLLTALVLLVAACGDDQESSGSGRADTAKAPAGTATTGAEATGTAATGCRDAEEPPAKDVRERKAPSFRPARGKQYTAVLQTSCGTVEIRLATRQAPKTTGSFISLVREGFYDRLSFHRIVAGFVVQGGDPLGTGEGGPGYSITEAPPKDLQYDVGVVAMAKTQLEDPGTSGSQFFIVTGPQARQSLTTPDYALVGKVSKGMDVVKRLGELPSDPASGDRPIEPVVIEKASIRES